VPTLFLVFTLPFGQRTAGVLLTNSNIPLIDHRDRWGEPFFQQVVSLGRNPSLGLIAAGGPRLPVLTRMAAQARIFDHLVKVMQTCADPHSDQRRRVFQPQVCAVCHRTHLSTPPFE